jgi:ATP:ADP antiporter, AAA family
MPADGGDQENAARRSNRQAHRDLDARMSPPGCRIGSVERMARLGWRPGSGVIAAMAASAMVGAQFVAARAGRDALFLTQYDPASLPPMIVGSSLVSIGLVAIAWVTLRRVPPAQHVPATFAASAGLLVLAWSVARTEPGLSARLVYLQISGLGPLLGSGFWLIATERFDPRTAKRHFGEIAAAGTAGGLVGGLLAERTAALVGIGTMVPLVAVLQALCAWRVRALASAPLDDRPRPRSMPPSNTPSPLRVLAEAPYLRSLVALVLLGTMGAVFVDYALKAEAKATFGSGADLARFFAVYYGSVSLVTLPAQVFGARPVLQRFGLAAAASAPSVALFAGSVLALVSPGLRSLIAAHGAENVFRGSLLRAGYELVYTPLAPADKRAIKATIDVAVARVGEIAGAVTVQTIIVLLAAPLPPLLACACACSGLALLASRSLTRGYVQTLERSLVDRAAELDLSEVDDRTTRTVLIRSVGRSQPARPWTPAAHVGPGEIAVLHSADEDAIRRVLAAPQAVAGDLVPHVIPLLARDGLAAEAIRALRQVAEEHVGALVDALIDPNQPFAVRRRLARVFSVCVSQRAADGLLLGLDDLRFEVRFNCGVSLAAITEKNTRVRIERDRILDVVRREVAVSESVWRGRHLLDAAGGPADEPSLLERLVSQRATQSLAHVFTLLGLVLPAEPLRLAFCALHTDDAGLRGTAVEYLDAVLPPEIRDRVWPFIEHQPSALAAPPRRGEVLAELMRSNAATIMTLTAGTLRASAPDPPASSRSSA